MSTKARLSQPVLYYSLKAAAKELDIEEEYLIQWIKQGKIRACFVFYGFEASGMTCGFVSEECDLKKANEEFQEQCLEIEANDHYLNYVNEPDYDLCVLNKIFSTEHSKMIIDNSHYISTNDAISIVLTTSLRGLWQVSTREEAISLLSESQDTIHDIILVPYIDEYFYSAKKMEGNSGIISGFEVSVKAEDIHISQYDMGRLYKYLYKNTLLLSLDGKGKRLEHKAFRKSRPPVIEMKQALVQMFINFLGEDAISEPYRAKELINKKLAALGKIGIDLSKNAIATAIKETREHIADAKNPSKEWD